jgi:hypothetical protein
MFYIEPEVMRDVARQLGRREGHLPFFRAGVIKDALLAATIAELHVDLHAQRLSSSVAADCPARGVDHSARRSPPPAAARFCSRT